MDQDLPCKVCEGSTVQVADNADGRVLLCVVDEDGILCSHGIYYPIRQCKSRLGANC